MGDVSFNLNPVTEKPSRQYRKGSKYDPILDAFMSGLDTLVAVDVEGKDANYLRMHLNKRVDARNLRVRARGKKCENHRVYVQHISNSHAREYLPGELAILLATVLIMRCRISVIGKKLVKNESYIRARMTFWVLLTRIMDSRG